MKQVTVVWLAGFFTRAPEADLETGSYEWRAFRYIDGGIWYARDDEDYTVARKDKCHACAGRCLTDLGAGDGETWSRSPWPNPRKLVPPPGYGVCRICDGRGFVFVPSRINQG